MIQLKSGLSQSLVTLGILFLIIIPVKLIPEIPWWGFIIPVFLLGLLLKYLNFTILYFFVGFLAGFIIWAGFSIYFDIVYSGAMLQKLGGVISVSRSVVILISGFLGGLLSGLALFAGQYLLISKKFFGIEGKVW